MTRRSSALQTSWLDAAGRPAVPPAPTSGVRPCRFVVRLGADISAGLYHVELGRWPMGEPAIVEADPAATERAMEARRLRVEAEMRRKGKPALEDVVEKAKKDKRLSGGVPRRRRA